MCEKGEEPLSSMGVDTPLAVLSKEPQPLFNYFKQLFAQVTNPPIDAIREEIITSTTIYLGSSENLLGEIEENTQKIKLATPILTNEDLSKIRNIDNPNFKVKTINASYGKKDDEYDLELALDLLCQEAEKSILEGYNIIILSDKNVNDKILPIPSLLALSAVHHYLIKNGLRSKVDLIIESGEPREVHHFATLIGFGASAVNPYLVYESILKLQEDKFLNEDYNIAAVSYTHLDVYKRQREDLI